MKRIVAVFLLGLFFPLAAYANCPSLDKVTFKCSGAGGKEHCAWTAPWWEGYQGTVDQGEHPTQFVEAFWMEGNDAGIGSIDCFYRDRTGELVTLSQNDWGGVAKPTDENLWQEGNWPGDKQVGPVCTDSPETCAFNYG